MEIASSALLQIGDRNSGNQPGADTTAISPPTSKVVNLNPGGQLPSSDDKMFVDLSVEWTLEGKKRRNQQYTENA